MDTKTIMDSLEKLAAKLGTTAEYLWPKFVGSAKVTAILFCISGAIAAIIFTYFVPIWIKKVKNSPSGSDDACGFTVLTVVFIALAIIATTISLSSVPSILYPEKQALIDIAQMFK